MSLVLPEIRFNHKGIMYVEWLPYMVPYMDIVREIVSLIDCNPEWAPDYSDIGEWSEKIAKRATSNLLKPVHVRGLYTDREGRDRTLKAKVTGNDIVDMLLWIKRTYKISLLRIGVPIIEDGNIITSRIENTPRCPGCNRWLELSWHRWGDRYYNHYNLMWVCPRYSHRCEEAIGSKWPHKVPQFIHRQVISSSGNTELIQTYFHNWEYDGNPIPSEYLVGPFTEWNIDAQVALAKEVPVNRKKRDVIRWTPEMIQVLRDTYNAEGPIGFFRKYRHMRISLYSIQHKAYELGLTKTTS